MKFLRRLYAFCFDRCMACGKRIPAHKFYCSEKCDLEAMEMQTY